MGSLETCQVSPLLQLGGLERPLIVVGVTHPETCLVLRGRLRALRESGLRVVLISSPGPLLEQIAAGDGVECLSIAMRRGISPLADLLSLFRLCFAMRRLRPVLAEFSTPKAGLLGNIASFLCRVPVRIYVLRGLRLETASGIARRILCLSERITAACCHLVLCNSESLRNQALALGVAKPEKLRVIGGGSSAGVDVRHFAPRQQRRGSQAKLEPDTPVIGFTGRLTRDKGIPELLLAFDRLLEQFPHATLLLVGWFDDSDDALSGAQRAYIESHPRIVCTGFVADTAPWYHAMDVLVLPSWREGFPNAILEGSASGLPVVSTRVTGARDAVQDGRTGLLVQPGDPEALAGAIGSLLRSPGLRRRMGGAGRAWVADRFARGRVQNLTVNLYRGLIRDAHMDGAPARARGAAAAAD